MTIEEFRLWCVYTGETFPDTGVWLKGLPSATRERWHAMMFTSIDLEDAQAAIDAMATGHLEKPAAYNREDLPRIVSDFARKRSWERSQQQVHQTEHVNHKLEEASYEQPSDNRSMAQMLRDRLQWRLDQPDCPDDVRRRIRANMGTMIHSIGIVEQKLQSRETWYSCKKCRDMGLVTIVHGSTLADACKFLRGRHEMSKVALRTCAVPCTCAAGDRAAAAVKRQANRGDNWVPMRADDWKVVVVSPELSSSETMQLVIDWARWYLDEKRVEILASRDHKDDADDFSGWNSGAEVEEVTR